MGIMFADARQDVTACQEWLLQPEMTHGHLPPQLRFKMRHLQHARGLLPQRVQDPMPVKFVPWACGLPCVQEGRPELQLRTKPSLQPDYWAVL